MQLIHSFILFYLTIQLRNSPGAIIWKKSDNTTGLSEIRISDGAVFSTSDIDVLKQIYASDDGFRDSDDNEITIDVSSFPFGDTVEGS